MRLIIRVCDYDWGKRDDNLGEIVVDARDLVGKDTVTFDLTRNGKPEKGTIKLAARFVPTSTISITPNTGGGAYAGTNFGDGASGASSSETLVLKIISATGLRKGDWVGHNDVYVQAWRAPDSLSMPIPPGKKLPEPDKKITLPNESVTFPFAFPTRADSPGSAVLPCGDYAYVAYYVYAKVDKKLWKDPSLKVPIVIVPSRPVPLPRLLLPAEKNVVDEPIYSTKICCFTCGQAGMITIKLSLNRSAYAPGETVEMHGEVVNDSSIPVEARVVLKQHIKLQTTGSWDVAHTGQQKFRLYTIECEAHSTRQLGDLPVQIPAVPPSFYGSKGMFVRRDPLTYHYTISLEGASKGGSKVSSEIPVLISALPPTRKAVMAAQSNLTTNLAMTDPAQVQANAVLDDRPCKTVEEKTGFEDGLNLTPTVDGSGNVYNGNIYSHTEDSGGDSHGNVPYQPVVSIFPTAPTFDPNESTQPSEPDIEVPGSSVGHEEAFNDLLSRMANDLDARLAVDQWIKDNPSAASELTPEEFATVLKKVLYSFDQTSVARELVVGRGSVTVDHVVATMEACPFSKAELAKVMAPYVSDPENKDSILSQLYSFERGEVSKMFV